MKRLLACLALTACATVPAPPPERVAGCWINRSNLDATTMRWLPDPQRPGALTGDKLQELVRPQETIRELVRLVAVP